MPLVQEQSADGVPEQSHSEDSTKNAGKKQRMPRADLVLVFPCKVDGEITLDTDEDSVQHTVENWRARRAAIVQDLSGSGLALTLYYSRDKDEIFAQLAADDQRLRRVAEMNKHRLELTPQCHHYRNDLTGSRELHPNDRCLVSHLYKLHADRTEDDKGEACAIFRTVDRIQLIDYIVRETGHGCAGADVGQLMHDGDVLHYFPLHEQRKLADLDKNCVNAFVRGSSIDQVRDYFGERVAFYFLFISHLIKWLIVPAALGLWCLVVDLVFFRGSANNATATIFCAVMGFWVTFFIHFWRRLAAEHALRWGTLGVRRRLGRTRPEFAGVDRVNPVTGQVDRYYPWAEQKWKVLFSYAVLAAALLVLALVTMVLFMLRHIFRSRVTFQWINALITLIMNALFTGVAKYLTDQENHRSHSEYSNHLMAKTVIFKFVNCYISLYYIAFFEHDSDLFGVSIRCENDDCLDDLGSQLAIFMVMFLVFQNFMGIGLPYFRMIYPSRQLHTSVFTNPRTGDLFRAERQSKKEEHDSFANMDEILVLYGYATLFVVACPWVPLLALVSCVAGCFLDQKKLVHLYRRPFPVPVANNEPWDTAFDLLGMVAMLTNTGVAIFTSRAYGRWPRQDKFTLFLAAEFTMILSRVLVGIFFPAVPSGVKLLQMQQQAMVHRYIDHGGEDGLEERDNAAMTADAPPHVFDVDVE